MTCSACGTLNPVEHRVCSHCGSSLHQSDEVTAHGRDNAAPTDREGTHRAHVQQCWRCNAVFPSEEYSCPACSLAMKQATAASAVADVSLLQRLSIPYAGFWRRFVAYVIDLVILGIAAQGMSFIAGIILAITSTDVERSLPALKAVLLVLYIGLCWLYFATFESSARQATPGKAMLRMRVMDEDGGRLSFFCASIRYFAKYVSGLFLCAGFVMASFTERRQALHDMAAGSIVVKR